MQRLHTVGLVLLVLAPLGAVTTGCSAVLVWEGVAGGCGDGVLDGDEVCDDGNRESGDGCSADCRSTEICGNGVLDATAGEVCDDGNTASGDGCSADCRSNEICGNGIIDLDRGEVCDDNNTAGGDGCSSNCRSDETCGNGIIDTIVGETCDDGSTIAGDGCSATCQLESCGDGVIDAGEVCDDGNNIDGDNCSADCQSDETCGNGIVDTAAGEACDDGNSVVWDGCDTSCAIVEFQVNQTTVGAQYTPDIGMAADGSFVVTWEGADGHVWARRYDANATPRGDEFQVSSVSSGVYDTEVAMAQDGRFVAVWAATDSDAGGVWYRLYDAAGSAVDVDKLANTKELDTQWRPSAAFAADGSFVIVWSAFGEPGGASYDIVARRFTSAGAPDSAQLLINSYTTGAQTQPVVVLGDDGAYTTFWEEQNGNDGSNYGVYRRRVTAANTFTSTDRVVPDITTGNQWMIGVARNVPGDVVVAWDNLSDLGVRRYDASGAEVGSELTLSNTGSWPYPDVGIADDGRVVVVWEDADADGTGVFARRITNSLTTAGGVIPVNSYTLANQSTARVAVAPDGTFVVAWASVGQDSDGSGIFAQRFSAAGDPLGVGP